jgi:hypothetical protein
MTERYTVRTDIPPLLRAHGFVAWIHDARHPDDPVAAEGASMSWHQDATDAQRTADALNRTAADAAPVEPADPVRRFNVYLTQAHNIYSTAKVENVEAEDADAAYKKVKGMGKAVVWVRDEEHEDNDYLDIEVEEHDGASTGWRDDNGWKGN